MKHSVKSEARRTLYGQTSRKREELSADKKFDLILSMIENLATDLKSVNISVTQRIDRLEIELARKPTEKMSQSIDKRVNSQMKRVNKSMDELFDTLNADKGNDLETLNCKVELLRDAVNVASGEDHTSYRGINVVLRNLLETVNERLEEKVNNIIKDHLKINDIKV